MSDPWVVVRRGVPGDWRGPHDRYLHCQNGDVTMLRPGGHWWLVNPNKCLLLIEDEVEAVAILLRLEEFGEWELGDSDPINLRLAQWPRAP